MIRHCLTRNMNLQNSKPVTDESFHQELTVSAHRSSVPGQIHKPAWISVLERRACGFSGGVLAVACLLLLMPVCSRTLMDSLYTDVNTCAQMFAPFPSPAMTEGCWTSLGKSCNRHILTIPILTSRLNLHLHFQAHTTVIEDQLL